MPTPTAMDEFRLAQHRCAPRHTTGPRRSSQSASPIIAIGILEQTLRRNPRAFPKRGQLGPDNILRHATLTG
jgi:hypothetical protein